jgi:hypothetical integral membrane protein (TIGR02206 family)
MAGLPWASIASRDADRFTAYGTSHRVALVVLVLGALLLVKVGRALRERDPGDRFGKAMALAALCFVLPLQALYFTPDYWSLQRTLPIQLCDVASVVAVCALWSHRHWAVALTYYWGLTLTTQAILTPDLATPFPEPVFFLYWGMHLMVVWAAIYLTWGRGLAPDWRGYATSVAVTAAWASAVFAVNVALDTNYGYLNAKPRAASILDLLGPWPWYVVAEIVIITIAWALFTWPWVAARSRGRGGTQLGQPQQARARRIGDQSGPV